MAPSDPETLHRGIIHDYKSSWTILGPFGCLSGPWKGSFELRTALFWESGRKWSMGQETPPKASSDPETLHRGIIDDYKSCWTILGPFWVAMGAPKGLVWAQNSPILGGKSPEYPKALLKCHKTAWSTLTGWGPLIWYFLTHFHTLWVSSGGSKGAYTVPQQIPLKPFVKAETGLTHCFFAFMTFGHSQGSLKL